MTTDTANDTTHTTTPAAIPANHVLTTDGKVISLAEADRGTQWSRLLRNKNRRPVAGLAQHTLVRPDEITKALDQFNAYAAERATLRDDDAPTVQRRVQALGLLVDDAEAAVNTALADHADRWLDALAELEAGTRSTLTDAKATQNRVTPALVAARSVADWLHRSAMTGDLPVYDPGASDPDAAALAGWFETGAGRTPPPQQRTTPWERRAAALARPHAVLPELARPKALAKLYSEHRRLVDEYDQLVTDREALESERTIAEAEDLRAFADAIRDGGDDPGTSITDAVDTQLVTNDRKRASLAVDIRRTFDALATAVDEHRDAWLADVLNLGTDAAHTWTEASTAADQAHATLDDIARTVGWLTNPHHENRTPPASPQAIDNDSLGGDAA